MTVAGRLPNDVKICSYGVPLKIGISVTLETTDQAQALIDAIDILMPLFEKPEADEKLSVAQHADESQPCNEKDK